MHLDVVRRYYFHYASVFMSLALALAFCGCTSSGPSAARLLSIEYRPDDTSYSKQDTFFTYFDSGFLDKVEIEVDGDEVQEQLFYYEDERLVSILTTERSGNEGVEYLIEFGYDGDQATSATVDYSGTRADVNGPITVDGSGEGTLEYDEERLVTSELTIEVTSRQSLDIGGQVYDFRSEYTTTQTANYSWDEDLVEELSQENEEETVNFVNDVEDSRSTLRTESGTDYTYADGVLVELEEEIEYSQNGVDVREESTLDVEFNGDGQLRELTGTRKYANIESEYELEITYDDEGRISRIEDQDGNRWSFDYDGTETTQGVTLSSNLLPQFIDLEGRQVFEAISTQSHLRY